MKWTALPLLLALPTASSVQGKDEPPQATKLAITNVTIIDCTGAAPRPDMTVLVIGDRITEIGKVNAVKVPADAVVVPGTGKFVIPGLWDMHAHVESEGMLPLFVGNGVTGVRHMFTGSPLFPPVKRWRQDAEEGKGIGPRIVCCLRAVDGLNGEQPAAAGRPIVATTEAEGREAVRRLRDEGNDFVKVYPFLKPEVYLAILGEASRGPRKLAVAGHVPHLVRAADASDAGQKSLEHSYGILQCCSKDEAKLRKELTATVTGGGMAKDTLDATGAWRAQVKALDSYDEEKAAALFKKFVANGTWQVPTLVCRQTWARLSDPAYTADPRKRYLPFTVSATWAQTLRDGNVRLPLFGQIALTPADLEQQRMLFEGHLRLVGAMHKAGVKFLAGTDTPVPYCFPGSGLHDELELFVKAGLTPAEALRTATRNPAEYLERSKDLGTVEAGKLADLVLLDADPIADIKNVRKIQAVILGGRLFPKESVEKMSQGRKP